jgi:alkylation response protein AidB-like acyl-CoA dehydrogenase
MAMSDGAAVLLRQQLSSPDLDGKSRKVFQDALDRLISLDPDYAWTSGQWMTERTGGSDVRGTETVGRLLTSDEINADRERGMDKDGIGNELGEWRIDGFKWFSSATDADMCVLLAQTRQGLSAFFAPMRRRVPVLEGQEGGWTTQMNGVYLSRLKNKLGTKAVPTAELEIRGMRAYLLGKPGQGIKIISSLLNVTRLWTANGSTAGWSRGLAVSRAFTRARKVKGGMMLSENKQHVKWMADETVVYRAMTSLYMFGVALLGHSENIAASEGTKAMQLRLLPKTKVDTEKLLRFLTPLMKMCCSLASVAGLRTCMESLGGVGYCENNEDGGVLNVARLFRDCAVNAIWEGTGSVLAEDILRALNAGRKEAREEIDSVFRQWFEKVAAALESARPQFKDSLKLVRRRYEKVKRLVETKAEEELLWQGRVVVSSFEAVVCALLLMANAAVDGNEIAVAVAERWVMVKVREGPVEDVSDWRKEAEMDKRIFLGSHEGTVKVPSKL